MVKKLLQQRQRAGDIASRHHYSGRKPVILEAPCQKTRTALGKKPDLTLKELRQAVALACSLPALHYALAKMGLTYKKRRSGPVNRTGRISPKPGGVAQTTNQLGPGQVDLSG